MNNTFSNPFTYVSRLCLLAVCLAFAGCAGSSVSRLLPNVGNMYVARHYLGAPTSSEALPDGNTRHEWLLDRVIKDPAHWETQRVYLGHDSDGFPVFEDIEVYVRDRILHQTCRVVIVADREDRVLTSASEGNSCDVLLRVPTTY